MRTTSTAAFAFALLALPHPGFAALVAAYGLNAQSGTTAADASGNNNTGTMSGTTRVAGKFGSAQSFTIGSGSFINVGNGTTLQITGSMTISGWIRPSSFPGGDAAVVSKRNGTGGYQLDSTQDTGPRTIGFKLTTPTNANMIRYGATTLQVGQWYHVAGVYNAGAQTMDVYLNGVLDNGTQAGTITSTQKNFSTNVNIGKFSSVSDSFFLGTIDEVRIYNSALTQAQVQTDMNTSVETLAPDTTAPTTPSNFAVTAASTTQINLSWGASTDYYGVTAYKLERCSGAGCGNFAEVAAPADPGLKDTGLAAGTSYSYRLRATDAASNLSAYTNVASATTLSAPPSGGRVGVYPFEEGSGATTADFSDVHNNGTLDGANWTTAGKYGNALVFPGGSLVDLGNPGTLQLTGSMTVSAWINSSTFPGNDAAIVSKLSGGDLLGYQLDTTVDTGPRTIGFKLSDAQGALMARYGSSVLQPNTWYHVAGVYDAQAQTLNVYLNGVLDNGTLTGTVSSTQHESPMNVYIGKRPGANGYEFLGIIDDVRIYNRALSQAEIQTDMAAPASGPAPDTIAPSAPTTLSATAASTSQINLAWTASTDNVAVTGYRVERCQGAGCGSFAQIGTPVTTTFGDTELTAGTSYSYRARAADAAGNLSAYSNVASATTATVQGQMYFIEPDHLDTPRMISSSTSTTVWRWDQTEPFGDSVPNADADGDGIAFDFPLRFPGQYFDRETNNYYNMARDYSPEIGRYIEPDPIGLPGGRNIFAYVDDAPLDAIDPEGLLKKKSRACIRLGLTVELFCKVLGTRCEKCDSCDVIDGKIIWKRSCLLAQALLTRYCFPKDRTHKQRIEDERRGIRRCIYISLEKGCPQMFIDEIDQNPF